MSQPTETTPQKPRLEYWKTAPEVFKALRALEEVVKSCGLDPALLELVKLRVSQINGCAFCADMHYTAAQKSGESGARLNLVAFWEEAPHFTPREKAALAWAEKLTRLTNGPVTDADFGQASTHFDGAELAKLTLAIAAINSWNRFGVGFRLPVGYQA